MNAPPELTSLTSRVAIQTPHASSVGPAPLPTTRLLPWVDEAERIGCPAPCTPAAPVPSAPESAPTPQLAYHTDAFHASAPVADCVEAFLHDTRRANQLMCAGICPTTLPPFIRLGRVIKDPQAALHLQKLWTELRCMDPVPRPGDMRNLTVHKVTRTIGTRPLDANFTLAFTHAMLALLKLPMSDERTIVLTHIGERLTDPVAACRPGREKFLQLAEACSTNTLPTSTFALYATVCSAPFDATALLDHPDFVTFCTCKGVSRDSYTVRPAVWCLKAILEDANLPTSRRLALLRAIFTASHAIAVEHTDTLGKRGARAQKFRSEAYHAYGVPLVLDLLRLHQLLGQFCTMVPPELQCDRLALEKLVHRQVTRSWPDAERTAFARRMQTWRSPYLLYAFAAKQTPVSCERAQRFSTVLRSITANTYTELRHAQARLCSLLYRHLDEQGLLATWRRGESGFLTDLPGAALSSKQKTWTWHDTDDENDFLNFGSEVQGSCLHADVDYAFSQVLVTRMQDACKRLLLIKNASGSIEARAMWLLLADERGQHRAVAYLSKPYHNSGISLETATTLLRAMAVKRQQALGWPVALHQSLSQPGDTPARTALVSGLGAGLDYCETTAQRTCEALSLRKEFFLGYFP